MKMNEWLNNLLEIKMLLKLYSSFFIKWIRSSDCSFIVHCNWTHLLFDFSDIVHVGLVDVNSLCNKRIKQELCDVLSWHIDCFDCMWKSIAFEDRNCTSKALARLDDYSTRSSTCKQREDSTVHNTYWVNN